MRSVCLRVLVLLLLAATMLPAQQVQRLAILHTNDLHASFVPHEATWVRSTPRPTVGGMVRLQQAVDSVRAEFPLSILLDAGDVMTGNPIADIPYHGAEGGALLEMMNRIGYDAWCFGNHDFDISQENLRNLTRVAKFPSLCANVVDEHGAFRLGNTPYVILERSGIRIGVIGLMSQELTSLVSQKNLAGVRVLSPVETAQRYIDEVRPKVDLLILLTHQGADFDSAMAKDLHGVDVIVGGHSHTRIRVPRVVNGIRIVQTGSNCENLGVLEVTLQDKHPVKYWGNLVQLWAPEDIKGGTVGPLVDSMQTRIEEEYRAVLATLTEDWLRQSAGNPLGDFVTEVQRTAAMADVSFMNVHGIRKDLAAGPVTRRDLFEVLPFRNLIVTFQLTGTELEEVLRFYAGEHPAIIIGGVAATWTKRADGSVELKDVTVGGVPLDENRRYICAATDYFLGEAKKYLGIEPPPGAISTLTLYGAVEEAMKKQGTLHRAPHPVLKESH